MLSSLVQCLQLQIKHTNLPTEKHEIVHRRGKTNVKRKLAEIA